FFVTASSSWPVLLELMGSSLIDLNSFDQRLLAALRGDATLPPLRTVELEGPAASSFNPSAGLGSRSKSRGTGGARQQRPRKPGRDSSSGSGGASSGGPKFTVYATAEGLIGGHTSSGLVIQQWTEGVALPDPSALHRKTHVVYLKNHRDADATVYDVGPWNINDPYWRNPNGHPQAESGRDRTGRTTNLAGIDLMNGTWYKLLGLRSYDKHLIESTSGEVTWWFVN
ncbi:MAG: hypothetical protein HY303_01495, partial [Candidatus Wallbacteria bacterium]|nr:hypothetical protein [Candidatus Wallbacteria bacterium]